MPMAFLRRLLKYTRIPATPKDNTARTFWIGAAHGLKILALIPVAISGYHFQTGFIPPLLMMLLWLLGGVLVFWLLSRLGMLLRHGIQSVPGFFFASLVGALGTLVVVKSVGFGWPDRFYYLVALAAILLVSLWAGSLLRLFDWAGLKRVHKFRMAVLFGGSSLLLLAGLIWLIQDGRDPYPLSEVTRPVGAASLPAALTNPALMGSFPFNHFTYGSGTDQRRPEYRDAVAYTSQTVDATHLIPEWKGKKKKWRERYWGFSQKEFPLNGQVWMPEGKGPFPLILIVHGNHRMEDYSDTGYAYLGELLASRGFVTVSVDENFINGTWSGDFRGKEMPTRAWLLLQHLAQWRSWNGDPNHELYRRVDMENIMLVGHSRGGEAVSIAAAFNKLKRFPDNAEEDFDFDFNIKGIVAIAPTDYRYDRQVHLENINFLSLQGTYDSDESSFFGLRQYQRVAFTDSSYWFKAGLLIHGANHGQFNTGWGRKDAGAPFSWLLNLHPLISGEDQRTIAQVWISAFAESVLHGKRDYTAVLQSPAAAKEWLPHHAYRANFKDSHASIVMDFEEDIDLTSGPDGTSITAQHFKVWKEEELRFRKEMTQMNNALVLGWYYGDKIQTDSLATYTISSGKPLPDLDTSSRLLLSFAAGDPAVLPVKDLKADKVPTPDFRLELIDSLGQLATITISQHSPVSPRLKVQFLKLKKWNKESLGSVWEPTLETASIPLAHFEKVSSTFDYSAITGIRFIFDQTLSGVVILDEIGFGR